MFLEQLLLALCAVPVLCWPQPPQLPQVPLPSLPQSANKFLGGVPVLNYDLAYDGQSPVDLDRADLDAARWIFVLKSGIPDADIERLCQMSEGCQSSGHPDSGGVRYFTVQGGEAHIEALALATFGNVEFIEPGDIKVHIPDDDMDMETDSVSESDDVTWGLHRIGAPERAHTGKGVHVYVISTGILSSHDDFGGRAVPTIESINCPTNRDGDHSKAVCVERVVECKYNFWCARDKKGHGTHTAGVVAGRKYGVAPDAIVHAVQIFVHQNGTTNGVIMAAVDWVSANGPRPAVITMAWWDYGLFYVVKVGIDAAVSSGITVVVSANNFNENACDYSPSDVPSAITVGSMTSQDKRSYFSSWGNCVDIWAPGSSILSAWGVTNQATHLTSSTRNAMAYVAGGAALLLEEDPRLSPQGVRRLLLERAEAEAVEELDYRDTNLLLWVGASAATARPVRDLCPYRIGDVNPKKDCRCSSFQECSYPDKTLEEKKCAPKGTYNKNAAEYFPQDCHDCFCEVKKKCPSIAKSTEPLPYYFENLLCWCPDDTYCSTNGETLNCPLAWRLSPRYNGSRLDPDMILNWNASTEYKCIPAPEGKSCQGVSGTVSDKRGDCSCPSTYFCSTDGGKTANCPDSFSTTVGGSRTKSLQTCTNCKCHQECPEMSKNSLADDNGDCECSAGLRCSEDGTADNCKSSQGVGKGSLFSASWPIAWNDELHRYTQAFCYDSKTFPQEPKPVDSFSLRLQGSLLILMSMLLMQL